MSKQSEDLATRKESIRRAGHSEGFSEGYAQGHGDGWKAGSAEGYAEGVKAGLSQALATLRGVVSQIETLAYEETSRPVFETVAEGAAS